MPYYYGYGDFLANNIYCILLIPVFLLSLWAQFQVSGSFRRYSVANRRHVTGAQAAEAVLRAHGVYDVPIRPCRGSLTDHYDPRTKTVNLSDPVYNATSVAALGVAAHECGHAVQHATAYAPLQMRSALVPAVSFASKWVMWVLLAGMLLINVFPGLMIIGICLFALTTLFSFITLPVEINASQRAVTWLEEAGITDRETTPLATSALRSAAYTYVVAALSSLATLIYYILIAMGKRN